MPRRSSGDAWGTFLCARRDAGGRWGDLEELPGSARAHLAAADIVAGCGAAQHAALATLDVERPEGGPLRGGLDALGDDSNAGGWAEVAHAGDQRRAHLAPVQAGDDRAVQLHDRGSA